MATQSQRRRAEGCGRGRSDYRQAAFPESNHADGPTRAIRHSADQPRHVRLQEPMRAFVPLGVQNRDSFAITGSPNIPFCLSASTGR
jgi:hypothetical protein